MHVSRSLRWPRLALSILLVLPFSGAVVAATPGMALAAPAPVGGTVRAAYALGVSDGSVLSFGSQYFGSMTGAGLAEPVVGMAGTPSGSGYWMVAADGGIFSFGDAGFYGSTGHVVLNRPIVGMATTPTGRGYWLVAADGGIFSFGDAEFHGSTGATTLNDPIVGMAATPTGDGYWLVAADGGIFTFGDAPFYGSTGGQQLTKPIADMATTADGGGYWLVAEDGGVFTFGNAGFNGSAAGQRLNGRVVDVLPQGGDVTAPKLHSLSFSPASVDTSTGPKTVKVRARITDMKAGIYARDTDPVQRVGGAGSLGLFSPSEGQHVNAIFTVRVSGDSHDGVYETTLTFPAYSEQGVWRLGWLSIGDKVGNAADVRPATLASAGYPTTVQQTGPGDTTAPAIHSFSLTPPIVDTSAAPQVITVLARITDEVAGLYARVSDAGDWRGGASVGFRSPSGGQRASARFDVRVSGDTHDGVYLGTVTLPAFSEQGTWLIDSLSLTDSAHNTAHVDPEQLSAAGFPTAFQQHGPGDTTAPALHSLTLGPPVVDTSAGPQTVVVEARITDDIAGVYAYDTDPGGLGGNLPFISFESPSGGQSVSAPFGTRVSGDGHDGVYQARLTLPAFCEQGTWTVDWLSLNDKADNDVRIELATLTAAGYPTTFEVRRTG